MADPTDELEVIEPDAPEEVAEEEVAVEGAEGAAESAANDDADEVVVTLGDEPAVAEEDDPAKAPAWVRDLRKANREKDRRIRDLEQRLVVAAPAPAAVVVGERPKLADFDFDEDKHAAALDSWIERKQQATDLQRKAQQEQQAQQASWQQRIEHYNKDKAALKVKDYDDAEAAVDDAFSVVQNGVLLAAFDNSAALKYAIGKNPATLRELAAITDPIKFTRALSKIEDKVKVTPRKTAPIPERTIRGSGALAGATDNTLARLQAEADKTGDRSKVARYIRDKALKAA
jgi:hypothetical protein